MDLSPRRLQSGDFVGPLRVPCQSGTVPVTAARGLLSHLEVALNGDLPTLGGDTRFCSSVCTPGAPRRRAEDGPAVAQPGSHPDQSYLG